MTSNQASRCIGIVGLGDMGKMYTNRLSAAGWSVHACDTEERYEEMKQMYNGTKNVTIHPNGHFVSRSCDYIIYSVPAEVITSTVRLYGPSTKIGAIVGGQTSCKAPEIAAFEKFLPSDVSIISIHSMHGPAVDPRGQPLIFIPHRDLSRANGDATSANLAFVESVFASFHSRNVRLTAEEHDHITADTQAVTHAAFLSMGNAWRNNNQFPWQMPRYLGGIENIKINVMMRIYSNKAHVYAGLAILNPSARKQIEQYASSVTELFKLMLVGNREALRERVKMAGKAVFPEGNGDTQDLLLEDDVLDQFNLGKITLDGQEVAGEKKRKNNHLSLLAMVDCWWKLGIKPYDHMICSTPLFRLLLGATEYLFRNSDLLDEAVDTAIDDTAFRSDDLEFTFAARGWSDCVSFGDFEAYKDRFEKIQAYFRPRFPEATKLGNDMIKTILAHTKNETGERSQST